MIIENPKFLESLWAVDSLGRPKNKGVWEARCKFLASVNHLGKRRIIIPTQEEWFGFNMKQRDGE